MVDTKKITNQVLMGEGSPFLNLDNVKVAIDNSKNKDGLEYGRTRITVSTVGVGIKKDNLDAIEWAANELDVYLHGVYIAQFQNIDLRLCQ